MVRRNGWNEERRQAVESLMDAYGPLVLRLMYQLTGDVEAARALYIEVFLKAYRQLVRSKRLIGGKDWIVKLGLRVFKEALTIPDEVLDFTGKSLQNLPLPRLREALRMWKHLDRVERIKRLEDTEFPNEEAQLGASPLRLRTSQLLYATVAQVEAEYLHRGPKWTTYGFVVMGILAVVSVTYGVYGLLRSPVKQQTAASASVAAANPSALPQALDSLPVTVVGQFSLTQTEWDTLQLNHVTVDKNVLYLPTLVVSRADVPAIQIESAPLSSSGKELAAVLKPAGKIDLVPPATGKSGSPARVVSWVVKNWDLYVTDSWGIAVVDWSTTDNTANQVQQIYALYLPSGQTPSGKASLVKTLLPKSGAANDYTVTAGGGKVVIQSGYISNNPGSAEISLSLDVYSLSGTSPAHALGNMQQVSAPFGMMIRPVVTGDTLVFQGIAGQSNTTNAGNATWYTLGWNGQLSTFVGPPLDGQPHWAVKGTQGNIWWVETTPDMTKKNYVQLLMGQLVPPGSGGEVPAQSLNESVAGVRATGQDVLWLQSTDNKLQLVVTQAN